MIKRSHIIRNSPCYHGPLTLLNSSVRLMIIGIAILLSHGSSNAETINATAAARFLSQSTLGYTESHIESVQHLGYERWLDQQFVKSATLLEPYLEALFERARKDKSVARAELPYHKVNAKGHNVGYRNVNTAWLRAVLGGSDQLRQRTAWALSQIIVTANSFHRLTEGTSNYYDVLLTHAFTSYEDLLLAVTYHPVMGRYLSYLGNKKPDQNNNQQPDENYAREIMQLFTIGLWELNSDGSKRLDANKNWIPTYSNEDITELARVFTGFWLHDTKFGRIDWDQYDLPMSIAAEHHDRKSKSLLNGFLTIPANMNPDAEVRLAITKLANHPNVAPFLSTKLINHLVTSNPSPEYVARVAQVWRNTGGMLRDVIKAILLDPEARDTAYSTLPRFGRLKDPIQRLTNLLIGFGCGAELKKSPKDYPGLQWWRPDPFKHLSQAPLQAPSVFNFYESDYSKPGMIADADLVSPEFQILNDATASTVPNYLWRGLIGGFHKPQPLDGATPLTCTLASEPSRPLKKLLETANLLLAAGDIDSEMLQQIENLVASQPRRKEQAAVFAVAISPNSAVQR